VSVPCPAAIFDKAGRPVGESRTTNLSDGGALLHVPVDSLPEVGAKIHVTISVPRATANTRMLEDFASPARVVRHVPADGENLAGLAVQFETPLDIMLDA
jgi:hypothetical protein